MHFSVAVQVLSSGNFNALDVGNAGSDVNEATQRGNVGTSMLFVSECFFCAAFVA